MCFSGTMSFAFAAGGVILALVAYLKLSSMGGAAQRGALRFTIGVLYFVLMETLQGVSYWYIDDGSGAKCGAINSQLTLLGFAHSKQAKPFLSLPCIRVDWSASYCLACQSASSRISRT